MRFLHANKIFDGKAYLPEGSVLVYDQKNLLKDVVSQTHVEKSNIERFDGTLMPGFVNAHCHLELSHLEGLIPKNTGLPRFATNIVTQRNNISKEEISERMLQANQDMWTNGIVAVGDISNSDDSFRQKTQSKIYYHTFIELLGLKPEISESIFKKGVDLLNTLKNLNLLGSLSAHAPYSTSKNLIQLISEYDNKEDLPFCIHNQESLEETNFFKGTKSEFEDLYKFLNLDISWFKAPRTSSLESYVEVLPDKLCMLVHNTFSSEQDIKQATSKNAFWCFCPGANNYIENKLPDYALFKNAKNKICIGTDSLASNTQLDVVAEANLILKNTNEFTVECLLQAMTYNGAQALGIGKNFGRLSVGMNAGLNLIRTENSQLHFINKIN